MTKLPNEIIDKILIYLNDKDIAQSLKRKYVVKYIEKHSFSLSPGNWQPTGIINLNRLYDFEITFNYETKKLC